ncbi:DUF1349 domain-containing protein, partial [Streptomyces diastatochromogenes]
MDVELPELPFPLRTYGPDGNWSYEGGVLTGWAGPRQDRFVTPTGEALEPASDAPRLLGARGGGGGADIARGPGGVGGAARAGGGKRPGA